MYSAVDRAIGLTYERDVQLPYLQWFGGQRDSWVRWLLLRWPKREERRSLSLQEPNGKFTEVYDNEVFISYDQK
jgi:hypothetical protein